MKLSDAIRLGAMMSPQGEGGWMDGATRCALAAASDAVGIPAYLEAGWGGRKLGVDYQTLKQYFPVLFEMCFSPVPKCRPYKVELLEIIWTLNDVEKWTREQIADWVETVEMGFEAANQVVEEQPTEELVQAQP